MSLYITINDRFGPQQNILVVGYTDDNNYIYMDTYTGMLMEKGIYHFDKDEWYIYNLVIPINQ